MVSFCTCLWPLTMTVTMPPPALPSTVMRRHFLLQLLLQLLRLPHHLEWIHSQVSGFRFQVSGYQLHLFDFRFLDREDLEEGLDAGIGQRFLAEIFFGRRACVSVSSGALRARRGAGRAASATTTLTGIFLPATFSATLSSHGRASSHCCFGHALVGQEGERDASRA